MLYAYNAYSNQTGRLFQTYKERENKAFDVTLIDLNQ